MANYDKTPLSSYVPRLTVTEGTPNIPANTSPVTYSLAILKGTGSGKWRLNTDSAWSLNIGGNTRSGATSYDFRPLSQGDPLVLASGSYTIPHNSDGSKTISVTGSFTDGGGSAVGSGTASGTLLLTRIPRFGKRWDGTQEVAITVAMRWDGTQEVPISGVKRWDGTAEVQVA